MILALSKSLLAAPEISPNQLKLPKDTPADPQFIAHIFQIVFPIIGAMALLMIAIAGFRYTISGGEPGAIQKAKNQIIYSIIGLVVAIAGFAIVSFTLNRVIG